MVVAEHWMDSTNRVIGLSFIQYMALLLGLALIGWLIGGWFRRKK